MKLIPCSLFAVLPVLAASLSGQPDLEPAAELARLQSMAGHWQGSGTVVMQPGMPESKWTAESHARWVLGGHFLQSDTAFEFAGMGTMRLREYIGWDRENGCYVTVSVNNMGEGALIKPHFVDEDTMVIMVPWVREGTPQVERAVAQYQGEECSLSGDFLGPEGPVHQAFTGTMHRVDEADPGALEAAPALMPPPAMPGHDAMTKLAPMVGEYDFTGVMIVMPGLPATKIHGHDSIRTLFDGAIVQIVTEGGADGRPQQYEAHAYYAWDPTRSGYSMLFVNNMGEVGAWQSQFVGDDQLVSVFAGRQRGLPVTKRIVLDLEEGRPAAIVGHTCFGAAAPVEDFKGRYQVRE